MSFPFYRKILKLRFRTFKFLITLICIVIFIIGTQIFLQPSQNSLEGEGLNIIELVPPGAQTVQAGIYVMNLYDLNSASNTYFADFYLWFKWKGDIDPTENVELVNGVEDWGLTLTPVYEQPQLLKDDSFYQVWRVEGRFAQPLSLEKYPLDRQQLTILIENSVYTKEQLVYLPDKSSSGYLDGIHLVGWNIKDFELLSLFRRYPTNFGNTDVSDQTVHAILRYSLTISRPVSFFFWKLLLPLLIVVATSWGALLLNPEHIDSRITLHVTSLLTAVFLQNSYLSSLPEVGYLVLLDKIYIIAYLFIFISILEAIITAEWIKNQKPRNYRMVIRTDRLLLIFQAILFPLSIIALTILAYLW